VVTFLWQNDLRLELYWDEILISAHGYSIAPAHFRALRIPLDSKPDDHLIRSREQFTLSARLQEARRSPSWVVSKADFTSGRPLIFFPTTDLSIASDASFLKKEGGQYETNKD
jgi:hypothetical protein